MFWLGLQFFGAISLVWLVCLIILRESEEILVFSHSDPLGSLDGMVARH